MVAWGYPNMLVPLVPPLIFVDIVMIPVGYMILYQLGTTWKSFIIGSVLLGAILAFFFEPITEWLGIYELNHWRNIYSFPIYIFMAILFKWILNKIVKAG